MSSQESFAPSHQSQGQIGQRRRRSAPPPTRLSWPGSSVPTQSSSLSQSTTNINRSSKKTTRSKPSSSSKNKRQRTLLESFQSEKDDDNSLWVDRHAPKCRKDLCVAPKKIQEVATWLETGGEKLLILVGRPGIGKSAMVRVLAHETKTQILEWEDSYSTWSAHLESASPLNAFAQFLQQSGVGYSSLQIQQTQSTRSPRPTAYPNRVILLEELPNLANAEMRDQFRQLFTNHVQNSQVKTIWIYSDGTEGQSKPQDLERHIEPSVLYAHSKILQVNPATKSQMKKSLERIANAEQCTIHKDFFERMHLQSGGDLRYAIMSLQFDQVGQAGKSKEKDISTSADQEPPRDTRWTAFHALGKILYAKREQAEGDTRCGSLERPPLTFDPERVLEHSELDLGHALTYLGFHSADFFTDIEELSTAFDLFSDASYLLEQTTNYNYNRRQYNNGSTTVSCPIFPEAYVTSLAGRSIAYANRHPTPSRFRQLQAPKILEIRRKRTDNANHLSHLQHRMSHLALAGDLATTARATSSTIPGFVMDRLPFLHKIVPDEVRATLDQLHTCASEHTNRFAGPEDLAAALAKVEYEQQEILELDDIVDYDSSEEGGTNGGLAPLKPKNQEVKPHRNVSSPFVRNGYSTSAVLMDGRVSNELRQQMTQPSGPTMTVKRIANPYLTKFSKTVSRQSTSNNVRKTATTALESGAEVRWSRVSQPDRLYGQPEPASSAHISQPAIEAKSKSAGKVILTDV